MSKTRQSFALIIIVIAVVLSSPTSEETEAEEVN